MWAWCVPWIYTYYSTTMWVNKLIKILGYGEIQFEQTPGVAFRWPFGQRRRDGQIRLQRERGTSMLQRDVLHVFLGFLFRFLLGSKKKWYLYPELCLLLLGIHKKGWTSRSEGIPFWKLPRGFQVPCSGGSRSPARLVIKVLAMDLSACVGQNCTLV